MPPSSQRPSYQSLPPHTAAKARTEDKAQWPMSAWCVIVVGLSLLWPRYGFIAVPGLPNVTPFTLVAISSWAVLLLLVAGSLESRLRTLDLLNRAPLLAIAFSLWIGWRCFAASIGETPGTSLTSVLTEVAYLGVLTPIAIIASTSAENRRLVLMTVAASAVLIELLAMIEWKTGITVFSLISRLPLVHGSDLASSQGARIAGAAIERAGNIRVRSVFSHPIAFAQFIACVTPLLIHLAGTTKSTVCRIVFGIGIALAPISIHASNSRSGWACLIIAICVYFGLTALRNMGSTARFVFALVAALLIAAVSAVGPGNFTYDKVSNSSEEANSVRSRMVMIQKGLRALEKRPLAGYGEGQSLYRAGLVSSNGTVSIDNSYLASAVDSGWIGLALMITAWSSAALTFVQVAWDRKSRHAGTAAALGAGLIGFSLGQSVLSINANYALLYLFTGLSFGLISTKNRSGLTTGFFAPVQHERQHQPGKV